MNERDYYELLQLIIKIVNDSEGSWSDRRDKLIAVASEGELDTLQEFGSWLTEALE
jgi:hypothetical protein